MPKPLMLTPFSQILKTSWELSAARTIVSEKLPDSETIDIFFVITTFSS